MAFLKYLFVAVVAVLFMLLGSAVAGNDGVWVGMAAGVALGFLLKNVLWPDAPPRRAPGSWPKEAGGDSDSLQG